MNNLSLNTCSTIAIPLSPAEDFSKLDPETCVFQVRQGFTNPDTLASHHKARVLVLLLASLSRVRQSSTDEWFRLSAAWWEGIQSGYWTSAIEFLVDQQFLQIGILDPSDEGQK